MARLELWQPRCPSTWETSLRAMKPCDFFDTLGYPQGRAAASAVLLECVNHIKERLNQGIAAAGLIRDDMGYIRPDAARSSLWVASAFAASL